MLSLNIEALFLPRESLALFFTLEEFATFSDSLSFCFKIDQLPILWKFTCFQTSWLIFSYVCNKWLLIIFFFEMRSWKIFYIKSRYRNLDDVKIKGGAVLNIIKYYYASFHFSRISFFSEQFNFLISILVFFTTKLLIFL